MASNYQLKIVLPPGASHINIYLPFKIAVKEESLRSQLDIEGRRVIVINKENMHSYYAKNFLVILLIINLHIGYL